MQTEGNDDIFFTVHMGWWNDEEEPLKKQWEKMEKLTKSLEKKDRTIWLMGDFNSLDNVCLLYTSPSPRDGLLSRMPSSA